MKKIFLLLVAVCIFSTCSKMEEEETIIIGGGLMGSATAWQLANAGKKVLLIEQQDTVYTNGSSYGEARIARSSNRGDDIWSYLHNRSVKEVQELITFLNSADGSRTYAMEDIYTTAPVTYIGRTTIYDKLYASLIRQQVDYKMAVTPAEGKALFNVNLPDSVLIQKEYNKYSGTINPKRLIAYLHKAIQLKGSTILYNHKVSEIKEENGGYLLACINQTNQDKRLLYSKKMVTAAGPYTGSLLKKIAPYFSTLITPQRVFLAFLKIKKERFDSYTTAQKKQLFGAYPVINSSKGTRQGSFFSMIEGVDENGGPLIKIGGHFQRSPIEDLDKVWSKKLSSKEINWSKESTLHYFKLLNLPIAPNELVVADEYSCVYSLTDTEVPYVTNIPLKNKQRNPNFIVLGGMSGVGGKGAMTYGLFGANLLLQTPEQDAMYQTVQNRLGYERLLKDIPKN